MTQPPPGSEPTGPHSPGSHSWGGPAFSEPAGYPQQPGWGPPAGGYDQAAWPPAANPEPAPWQPMPGGWAQPGPYQPIDPAQRPLDGWSLAGLILGILPTGVIGAACSIVGLVRTGNPLRRGRRLAVAGLLLSVAWLVVAALAIPLVADLNSGPDSHPLAHQAPSVATPEPTATVTISARDLRPGDCFTMPAANTYVLTLEVVPCGQPHDAQDVTNVHLTDAHYPGETTIKSEALAACRPRVLSYLRGNADNLRLWAFFPTATIWALGNHAAHCVAWDSRSKFTGDVRDHH